MSVRPGVLILTACVVVLSLVPTPSSCQPSGRATRVASVNPPDWYTKPRGIPDTLLARGKGRSNDQQVAIDKAVAEARSVLADSIDQRWRHFLRNIETDGGDAHEGTPESVTLQGSTVMIQKVVKRGRTWTAYVLVGLPEGSARNELLRRLHHDASWYAKVKGTPAVRGLEGSEP